VSICGWVSPAERDALIASSHICVLPSVTENFGNFAVEAASRRRPVIVTRNTGVAEFLGDTAVIVESTAESLRDAIVHLVESAALRDELADRAFERVESLDPARVAATQEAIYRKALRSVDHDNT
jgi:glycosyltransferase involved in cell wall biosynthesis